MGEVITFRKREPPPIMNRQVRFIERAESAALSIDLSWPVINGIKTGVFPRRLAASIGRFLVGRFEITSEETEADECLLFELECEEEKKKNPLVASNCYHPRPCSYRDYKEILGALKAGAYMGLIPRPMAIRIVKLLRRRYVVCF